MELVRRNAASFWFGLARRRSMGRGSADSCGGQQYCRKYADGGDGRRLARARRETAGERWWWALLFSWADRHGGRHSTFLIASLNGGFPFWHRYF
jgi:hypothetical protein